jgi:diadenylate cyclase
VIVTAADMTMLRAIFGSVSEVFVLAVIILFQPEIRRLLLILGQNRLVRGFMTVPTRNEAIAEVAGAVSEMSNRRLGALIAIERSTGLRSYVETGERLQAEVSRDLLVTIFYARNPLHDGAVIIRSGRIEAARCILPVSTSPRLSPNLGLRHRAAVGLTEQTDAFVVVVSEETGAISIADGGILTQGVTSTQLRVRLQEALSSDHPVPSVEPAPEDVDE